MIVLEVFPQMFVSFRNMTLFPSDAIFLCLSHFFWVTGTLGLIRSLSVGGVRVFIKNINPKTVLNAIDKFKVRCYLSHL